MTLWLSLGLVILGGIISLVGIRKAKGGTRLAAPEVTTGRSILNSVAIAFTNPRVGLGCLIRVVNTAPQFGFLVFLPFLVIDLVVAVML